MKPLPPQEKLTQLFDYNANTGSLSRKERRGKFAIGFKLLLSLAQNAAKLRKVTIDLAIEASDFPLFREYARNFSRFCSSNSLKINSSVSKNFEY